MSTIHISGKPEDVAKTVLMPGDPLRAKFIAETYLERPQLFNEIRGMLGYTGFYEGVRVSVMGSGMGCPSIGIYSYELFEHFQVENIIRVGTCGTPQTSLNIGDLVFAMGSSSSSAYAGEMTGKISAIADYGLLSTAVEIAKEEGIRHVVGNVRSGDSFYGVGRSKVKHKQIDFLAYEMESYALYINAAYLHKKALCILTVTDERYEGGKKATPEQRQTFFTSMMEIALKTAKKI